MCLRPFNAGGESRARAGSGGPQEEGRQSELGRKKKGRVVVRRPIDGTSQVGRTPRAPDDTLLVDIGLVSRPPLCPRVALPDWPLQIFHSSCSPSSPWRILLQRTGNFHCWVEHFSIRPIVTHNNPDPSVDAGSGSVLLSTCALNTIPRSRRLRRQYAAPTYLTPFHQILPRLLRSYPVAILPIGAIFFRFSTMLPSPTIRSPLRLPLVRIRRFIPEHNF